jgi:riboflavin-specific deaminase-like protein
MFVSDEIWSLLRELRESCRSCAQSGLIIAVGGGRYAFFADPGAVSPGPWDALFAPLPLEMPGWREFALFDDRLYMSVAPGADAGLVEALRLYVPLCTNRNFYPERVFVIVHMAQSLDGMVATESGNSKWIGNDANLVHAHRLRALVDGVVVGGVTARLDMPSLNVRHVAGRNPVRIVFSDSFDDPSSLPAIDGMKTLFVRSQASVSPEVSGDAEQVVCYGSSTSGAIVEEVLEKLHAGGISSILIEGGPTTFQSFLAAGAVDWLQLHIAPLLFGSGTAVLEADAIAEVADAIELRNVFYVIVDDAVMMTGQL